METSSEEAEGNSASKKMENDISADLYGWSDYKTELHWLFLYFLILS